MSDSDAPLIDFETAREVGLACVGLKVQAASRALGRRFDEAFRAVGLTGWQFSLLMTLNRPTALTIGQLADALGMDRTTTTANLKPLERRDLLMIIPDQADARVRRITLTDAGRSVLAMALPHWRALNESLLGRLSEGERATLWKAFKILMEPTPEGRPEGGMTSPPTD